MLHAYSQQLATARAVGLPERKLLAGLADFLQPANACTQHYIDREMLYMASAIELMS
jgi:hypothetical protein